MLRSEGPSDYRKALVAAGAAVGVGLIAYRLWSRRRPASEGNGSRRKAGTGTPPTQRRLQKDVEEIVPVTSASSSVAQEPSTDKAELRTFTAGKESIFVNPDTNGTDILSTSGTFVKVSPSVSPVGFEEIGASYVGPMSMPSTPPLLAEPLDTKLNEPNLAAGVVSIDALSSSSFITVSAEQPEAHLPHGGSSESDTSRTVDDVSITEKNDIVVIGTNSDRSSENGSEEVEIEGAAAVYAAGSVLEEELDQSVGTTEAEPTADSSEQGADVTVDTPED